MNVKIALKINYQIIYRTRSDSYGSTNYVSLILRYSRLTTDEPISSKLALRLKLRSVSQIKKQKNKMDYCRTIKTLNELRKRVKRIFSKREMSY